MFIFPKALIANHLNVNHFLSLTLQATPVLAPVVFPKVRLIYGLSHTPLNRGVMVIDIKTGGFAAGQNENKPLQVILAIIL